MLLLHSLSLLGSDLNIKSMGIPSGNALHTAFHPSTFFMRCEHSSHAKPIIIIFLFLSSLSHGTLSLRFLIKQNSRFRSVLCGFLGLVFYYFKQFRWICIFFVSFINYAIPPLFKHSSIVFLPRSQCHWIVCADIFNFDNRINFHLYISLPSSRKSHHLLHTHRLNYTNFVRNCKRGLP